MKICLIGSMLRHTIVTDTETYSGWGGMTESSVAPFAALLDKNSVIYFIGNIGKEDLFEVKAFYEKNYPIVNATGIGINPNGTDMHYATKDFVRVKLKVEPTKYEQIEPYIKNVDVVIFNFGNIDDIDPEAIEKVRKNSQAFIHIDVHRKPFGADENGYVYSRGWPDWEKYLRHADSIQMNQGECEALFQKKMKDIKEFAACAKKILSIGVKRAIITLGDQGAILTYRAPSHQYVHIPPVPSKAIDPTGSGDAFAAGYLVATHEGKNPIEAAKFGSLVASVNCEFMGYIKNTNRQEIEKRLPIDYKHFIID